MRIRTARASDWDAIRELLRELGYGFDASRAFAELLRDPAHVLLVAEEDGLVVGYANVNVRVQLHHERPVGTLDELCVAESARSRGLGAALVDAVVAEAAARGAEAVEVATNVRRERARRFYERCGFEATSWKLIRRLD